MNSLNSNNIDKVWANICKHEGETFFTQKKKNTIHLCY